MLRMPAVDSYILNALLHSFDSYILNALLHSFDSYILNRLLLPYVCFHIFSGIYALEGSLRQFCKHLLFSTCACDTQYNNDNNDLMHANKIIY